MPTKKIVELETILVNNVEPYRGGRLDAQISLLKELGQQFVIGENRFDVEKLINWSTRVHNGNLRAAHL